MSLLPLYCTQCQALNDIFLQREENNDCRNQHDDDDGNSPPQLEVYIMESFNAYIQGRSSANFA